MSIVKNQHYVPRVYLEKFAFRGEQIHVFDKSTSRVFTSSVRNVACEKFFYDIPTEYLPAGVGTQVVEKHLAELESRFAPCRDAILSQVEGGGRFEPQLKQEFANYLVLQMLRTKTHREQTAEVGCLIQALVCGNPELATELEVPKELASLEQARMMFSPRLVAPMRQAILSHIWVVGVNRTGMSLYTSDSPVVRYPHIRDPLLGTTGVACRGIEIDFPLSPQHVLMACEREHHRHMAVWENKAFPFEDANCVLFLNRLQTSEAYRQIYSDSPDFIQAIELLKQLPALGQLDRPRAELANPSIGEDRPG